jgi:catechol 2,3-dioxygenase-like lactoylglutathione lyase family enzyme
MIDHLELFVADLPRSLHFFERALGPLGYAAIAQGPPAGFGTAPDRVDFWLRQAEPSSPRPHFAFHCETRAQVDEAHRAALDAGGVDNGAPKLLVHLHPNYYAGFVRDPDGHNVEFVCHRAESSATAGGSGPPRSGQIEQLA